jgi:hypothetical protein
MTELRGAHARLAIAHFNSMRTCVAPLLIAEENARVLWERRKLRARRLPRREDNRSRYGCGYAVALRATNRPKAIAPLA